MFRSPALFLPSSVSSTDSASSHPVLRKRNASIVKEPYSASTHLSVYEPVAWSRLRLTGSVEIEHGRFVKLLVHLGN